MIGIIKGTGACVPEKVLSNQELTELVDTSDEWIRERTGIRKRHIAVEETTVSMAVKAGKRALQNGGVSAEDLDMVIVATISPKRVMPCTACEVQKELGATKAVGFDMSAACSGFLLAYTTATAYIKSGIYKNILVIGSECLSDLVDWQDRGTCILFGDGAGAAVVSAAEGTDYQPALYSDGGLGEALTLEILRGHQPFRGEEKDKDPYMRMNGQEVFKFATRKVPQIVEEVLKMNHLEKEEITYYLLHQANQRIVESVAKRLKEPMEKFPMNLMEYGNTSSASIPILLNELNEKQMLKPGDKLVLAGFGGGLTWGATIIQWT